MSSTTYISTHLQVTLLPVESAIESGLEVISNDVDANEPAEVVLAKDQAWAVLKLVERIGVRRILEALRDGADCAAAVALGSEDGQGGDMFGGVTQDDLKSVAHALGVAIEAVGE